MNTELIHVGFGNVLAMNRVIGIASPNSAPIKRLIQQRRDNGLLIDMTSGRRTKSVIFISGGDVVLAALAPETIVGRLQMVREGQTLKREPGSEHGDDEL